MVASRKNCINTILNCFLFFLIISNNSVSSVPENQYWKDFFTDKQIWDMGPINRIEIKNDNIFVCGFFDIRHYDSLKFNGIAELQDSLWLPLGNGDSAGIQGNFPIIRDMAIKDSTLIIVGYFDSAGCVPARNIAYWNINTREWIPKGYEFNGVVASIEIVNDKIFVGGHFDTLTTSNDTICSNIVKFDGNQWDSLSIGLNNAIYDMTVKNNLLYVVGSFDSIGVVPTRGIGIWDDSLETWSTLGNNGPLGLITTVCKVGNDIYFGGIFDSLKIGNDTIPCKNIARWNGTTWDSLQGGIDGTIIEMKTDGYNLFVTGDFTKVFDDTLYCQNIVSWDGANWHSFGTGTDQFCFTVEPHGDTVFVGGAFNFTGDISSERMGIWVTDSTYSRKFYKEIYENTSSFDNILKLKCIPNPFSDVTSIDFFNDIEGKVDIRLFDMSGIELRIITSKFYNRGWYTTFLSLDDLSSGAYVCKMTHNSGVVTLKLIFIK